MRIFSPYKGTTIHGPDQIPHFPSGQRFRLVSCGCWGSPRGGRSFPRSWDAYSPHPDQKNRVVCRGMLLYKAFLFFMGIRLTPFLTPSWRKYRHQRVSSHTDGPGQPGPSWEDYTLLTSLTFCCIRMGRLSIITSHYSVSASWPPKDAQSQRGHSKSLHGSDNLMSAFFPFQNNWSGGVVWGEVWYSKWNFQTSPKPCSSVLHCFDSTYSARPNPLSGGGDSWLSWPCSDACPHWLPYRSCKDCSSRLFSLHC